MSRLQSITAYIALAAAVAGAATVTVDHTTEYQEIVGFGAHGSQNVWWSGGPFASPTFVTTIVDDLGLTISRNEFYPDFEETNENSSASDLNMSAFNWSGQFVNKQKAWIVALKNQAAASGEPIKFITSYWSPPAWMKTNNSTINGGALKSIAREEFAEYVEATYRAYQQECGVDLYAMSLQNELAFEEPYNSCVYTPEEFRDMIKVVGPRIHAYAPDMKIFGAEDMLSRWTVDPYAGMCQADPVAREHLNVFAVHGYSDGVHPIPSSSAASAWKTAWNNVRATGKQLWMTETSGYSNNWSGATGVADAIFAALKYGKISAWVWWQLAGDHTAGEILMPLGQRGKLFYVSKQYYRYIRPGATMVQVDSDDANVFVLAFNHKTDHTLTLVILNWNSGSAQITLSGDGLPSSFTQYTTSSGLDCANQGAVGTTFTLGGNTVNTLVATGYSPPTATLPQPAHMTTPRGRCTAEVFSLDGRLLRRLDNVRVDAEGRFAWDGRDSSGRHVAAGSYYSTVRDAEGRTVQFTIGK